MTIPWGDLQGLDGDTLAIFHESDTKAESIFLKIESLVTDAMMSGVLCNMPPPLMNGTFAILSNGMLKFHAKTVFSI